MDMEFMDLYRRPSYDMNMQSFNAQAHAQAHAQQAQQFPYWNPQLMAIYPNTHHRSAVMMPHPAVHASKQTEPKPRLAKDEVEVLEAEFTKNQKPNSSTKRDLAEKMGVEVPRINNWFQNRRAKEKQMRKAREFEAQQAKERAASDGKSSSDAEDQESSNGLDDRSQHMINVSTAVFQNPDVEDDDEEIEDDAGDLDDDLPMENFDDAAGFDESKVVPTSYESGSLDGSSSDSDGYVHVGHSGFTSSDHESMEAVKIPTNAFHSTQPQTGFHSHDAFPYMLAEQPQSHELSTDFSGLPSHTDVLHDTPMFTSFGETDYFGVSHAPSFPSQMLPTNSAPPHNTNSQTLAQEQLSPQASVKMEHLSPSSMSASPPATADLRFKSPPPPADIAGRRNMRRPAPLGLSAMRSSSAACLIKTGIEPSRRCDAPSPRIRRIASSTGLSGRIQKPLISAGPRSPFTFDRNRDTLLQTIHQTSRCSPVLSSLTQVRSPLTPDHMNTQAMRETTVSTTASDEEQGYTFGALGPSFFKAEHTIKTPPGTPGLSLGFQDSMYTNPVDQAWNFAPQDEPLPTPSLCSHGSELEFSMAPSSLPSYVASQPPTPSFGPTYNSFFAAHGLPATEYTFPDSYPNEVSTRSSPSQSKSKTFQFAQNITPQDFGGEK